MDGAATPGWAPGETPAVGATPAAKKGRSRWDETPAGQSNLGATPSATPGIGATPMGMTPGATPMGAMDMPTPSPSQLPTTAQMTPEQYQVCRRCIRGHGEIGFNQLHLSVRRGLVVLDLQLSPEYLRVCQIARLMQ